MSAHARRSAVLLLILLGCGGGPARPAPPIEQLGSDEPVARDGLAVVETGAEQLFECARHDLALRVVAGGRLRDEVVLEGECHGACTEEAKAEGAATVAEIEAGIAAGTSSESELDYNFTECVFHGVTFGRTVPAAGEELALLEGETPGPHDIPSRYFRVAAEICGKVFVGEPFGQTYANRWSLADLAVVTEGAATAVIRVEGEAGPLELYRVTFTGCDPVEVIGDAS